MSDTPREPDASLGGNAVDQGARAAEVEIQTEDDVIETLRAQLAGLEEETAKERQERETAERARRDAEARARDAESRAQQADQSARQGRQESERATAQAQLDLIKTTLASHEGEMTSLEAAYASAQAEGDFAASAKVQRQMAVLGGRIAQLETGRDALDQRIKTAPAADSAGDGGQQQLSPAERKEAFIRNQPSRIQEWLRGPHGERYFNDRELQQDVAAAARAAQRQGVAVDSDEYIAFVEERVGLRQPSANADNRQQQTNGQQQNARGRDPDDGRRMTTAPAGGSTAGSVRSNADGSTSVYLTPMEKEMARRQDMTDAEYARHKRDLMNEGLIGPGARR